MADKVVTAPAAHDEKLLSAVEATLRAHNLRLKPGEDLGTITDAITAKGFKISAEHGYLDASQTTAGFEGPAHVNAVFEGLATQEPARFFPRTVDNIVSRDQLDREGKMKFLREQGLAAWEKLPQTA